MAKISELRGLWADKLPWKWGYMWVDFHQKWAWELVFGKIFKLLMKITVKFELLELKIVIFSKNVCFWRGNVTFFFQMRVLWMDLYLNWRSCEWQERCKKGVLRAAHPHTPFSDECPPPGVLMCVQTVKWKPLVSRYNWHFDIIGKLEFIHCYFDEDCGLEIQKLHRSHSRQS